MKKATRIALAACCIPFAVAAAEPRWSALREDANAKLSVDPASVKKKGDQVTLKYLVDYAQPQVDLLRQLRYASVVTTATVRCKPRTLSLGTSEIYSGKAATGVLLAAATPTPKESAFAAVEKGTSDEDLWRHACEKAPQKKP